MFQIKGIGEVLEGLIPYSQRHFSRIDRLERSTFLLDYTLTGMSVVDPQDNYSAEDAEQLKEQLPETAAKDHQEQDIQDPKENVKSSKKRKPLKSKDVAHKKKVKGAVAYVNASAISSHA